MEEFVIALITVGLAIILFMIIEDSKKHAYTVYVSKTSMIAISAYRTARKRYSVGRFGTSVSKARVLRELKESVPTVYHYLLDETRIEVKQYGREIS